MSKKEIVNSFKIFLCCAGTVIGAGYASGQEIMSFFVKYGKDGALGIFFCGLIFAAYIYTVLKRLYLYDIRDFGGYFGDKAGKSVVMFIEWVSYGFMFASFAVMVSGSGAVTEELFGSNFAGVIFMAALCFAVFLKGVKGFVTVNTLMTPLIIAGIIVLGVLTFFMDENAFISFDITSVIDNFAVSALLYISYNTITLIGVLIPLRDKIISPATIKLSAILCGVLFLISGIILWAVMYMYNETLSGIQVPLLYMAGMHGTVWKYVYGAVLYMAMITTAVSSGFAFLSFIREKAHIKSFTAALVICMAAVPLSNVGFASLVGRFYKFFGFLGLVMMTLVLIGGAEEFVKNK